MGMQLTADETQVPELGIKKSAKIWWTLTDEAPALATHAFLPVVRRFLSPNGVSVETADISLAARILAAFPERLTPAQRRVDVLAKLGDLAKTSRGITPCPIHFSFVFWGVTRTKRTFMSEHCFCVLKI